MLKRALDDKFAHLLKLLDTKADKSDLDALESRLMDVIRSLLDRFADKKDLKDLQRKLA